jgi:hypothetical protein
MIKPPTQFDSLLDAIPEPQAVRERLSQLACEASVMRVLLRAAGRNRSPAQAAIQTWGPSTR